MRRVVREIALLVLVAILAWGAVELRGAYGLSAGASASVVTMTLGFVLLAAHLAGRLLALFSLPRITGYLLAGIVFGPQILALVPNGVRDQLSVINELALGLIALAAGGELAIPRLLPRLRAIAWISGLQTVLIFAATVLALTVIAHLSSSLGFSLRLLNGLDERQVLAMGLILGLVATANSPASTVAVIDETRSRGPLSTVALGVTVVKDVIVIVLMGVTLSLARVLMRAGNGFDWTLVSTLVAEVLVSFVLGGLFGAALILYLAKVGKEVAAVVLATVFLAFELSRTLGEVLHLHLHFLLVAMAAGFVVENASEQGRRLIRGLETSSLPVYVIFFTLAGVGLDLKSLVGLWPLAAGFVLWRVGLIATTSWSGARLAGEAKGLARHAWTAFVAQAGVSLGLAELVALRYPEMGARIKTLVLAVIALNQLVGPPLFKLSLKLMGETEGMDKADA